MGLNIELVVNRGAFTLDVALRVADGETLALLGPNGSGKSTMLKAIAGLLAPERGSVDVNGRSLTQVGGAVRDVAVAPHERRIGLLGQDPQLFPHLSALENVAFGPRSRGESTARSREKAARWLDAVGLLEFGTRRPSRLSGGQQQRVAIARALAAGPDVLLLDEPMAALDVQNAIAVRTLLRERLGTISIPTIVVTHDVVDAMALADRVAILDDGRIVDSGTPAMVLGRPKNQFAASLVGVNLLEGVLEAGGTVLCEDGRRLRIGPVKASGVRAGDRVAAAFPPSAVTVHPVLNAGTASTSHLSSWSAVVGPLEPAVRGVRVPFIGDSVVAEVTTAEFLASGIQEGMTVSVSVDPAFVTVYASPQIPDRVAG